MTATPRLVPARVYLAWLDAISEHLAQVPTDKGASILLWQLDAIGCSNDAIRLVVLRDESSASTRPGVLAAIPDEQFDWEAGAVDFARAAFLTPNADLLIHDLVKITGISEKS